MLENRMKYLYFNDLNINKTDKKIEKKGSPLGAFFYTYVFFKMYNPSLFGA